MNAPILEKVLASPKLPTLPTVAVELLQLTQDPDVDLADIARLVQFDQALAAKILRTVNSSYYSLAQPCPTIKRALAYLGLSTVRSLVLGFSLVDLTRNCGDGFDLLDYWRRCVYSAAAARRLAATTQNCHPDEALLAGLMQDIGMLAMHAVLGNEYGEIVSRTNGNHHMLPYCETDALGFTHADAGAHLGERWRLPQQIVHPIRHHHRRGMTGGKHDEIVNAVILAYRVSNVLGATDPKPVLDMFSAMSQGLFHITAQEERAVLRAATQDADELSSLLEVQIGDLPDVSAMLSDADEALILHQARQQREQELVRQSSEAVTRQALTDAVTGVGNRKCFEQALVDAFKRARDKGDCLGLILVATDRFRSLKDRLGSRAGDLVLQTVAARLREGVGSAGIVCRCGGDEFAVILPGASRADAARTAERLRRAVERQHVDLLAAATRVEAAQVTASLGVAALGAEPSERPKEPEVLLQLADQALSAAKQAGHNCVRVFNPKPPRSSAA
ncbi:MAG: sensor domain-containing diguanylate cyclase [Planctomycetota bacterium]|jgi:diguanylate cyclase (GGDEF)-like protein